MRGAWAWTSTSCRTFWQNSDAWATARDRRTRPGAHGVSERRGCLALGVDRSSVWYVSHKPDQAPLRLRIRDLAATRMRYGYFRIYILLPREGPARESQARLPALPKDGLSLRLRRPRCNVSAANRSVSRPRWRQTRCGRWTLFRRSV